MHESIKKFKCYKCDYKTALKGSLNKHITVVHLGKRITKPYFCIECDKEFTSKSYHIDKVHKKIRYKCEEWVDTHITYCHLTAYV